jgi:hypothetical protein
VSTNNFVSARPAAEFAFLECGAFPPLFFFRFTTNNKQNKAAEKRRTPKMAKFTQRNAGLSRSAARHG